MPAPVLETLGKNEVLAHLRADLRGAESRVQVVGPYIDSYFVHELLLCIGPSIEVEVTTRPLNDMADYFQSAAAEARAYFAALGERLHFFEHPNVHAKVAVVDTRIAYVGSANFYRYSLHDAREVTVRGDLTSFSGLIEELGCIRRESRRLALTELGESRVAPDDEGKSGGVDTEIDIIDPIARQVLSRDPKAFVLKPRKRGAPR